MFRLSNGLLILTALACAPSHQMLHQSSAYFELCHSADFDPEVQPSERRACWSAWVEHYRRGQPADRVAYAESRIAEIERGDGETQSLETVSAATAELVRAPTDAESPGATVPDTAPTVRPDYRTPVEALCGPRLDACLAGCVGRGRECRNACNIEHRTCRRACY